MPFDRFQIEPEQTLRAIQIPKEDDHLVLWLRSIKPDLFYPDLLSEVSVFAPPGMFVRVEQNTTEFPQNRLFVLSPLHLRPGAG